jgi:hypothetical protein
MICKHIGEFLFQSVHFLIVLILYLIFHFQFQAHEKRALQTCNARQSIPDSQLLIPNSQNLSLLRLQLLGCTKPLEISNEIPWYHLINFTMPFSTFISPPSNW